MKKLLLLFLILFSIPIIASASFRITIRGTNGKITLPQKPTPTFTSQTFTNCGQKFSTGPSLSQCTRAYSGTEILKPNLNFNVIQGIQEFTVPQQGTYKITAVGAAGGASMSGYRSKPGKGALVSGEFQLNKGDVIKILVGQRGNTNTNSFNYWINASGGGGGTYVVKSGMPLIVAAGGNGSNYQNSGTNGPDGQYVTGVDKGGSGNEEGKGGGGGGGFSSNGGDYSFSHYYDDGGEGFTSGGIGGYDYNLYSNISGGFGGGGGGCREGGGGGGYQGGSVVPSNQSNITLSNYSAKSFNSGQNASGISGYNDGQGYVEIKLIR